MPNHGSDGLADDRSFFLPLVLKPSPALRWLAEACRQDGTALVPPPMSWDEVVALARRHRVESLLHAGLARRDLRPPPTVTRQLAERAGAIAAENLRAAVESKRVHDAFATAGLPLLFVKGLTLSQLAYGNAMLKMSRDLDLLVLPGQVRPAADLLMALGYRSQAGAGGPDPTRWHRWSKESGWIGSSGMLVELHGRLTDHPSLLPGVRADSKMQSVTIAPGITLPTLNREVLPAYLAVHGASSCWFRLKWLADLHALLRAHDPEQLEREHRAMRAAGAGRAAGLSLLLLEAVYGLRLGEPLRSRLSRDRAVGWLAAESLRQLEARSEPTDRRGGTLGIHLSQLLLGEHWTFPLREGTRRTAEWAFRQVMTG